MRSRTLMQRRVKYGIANHFCLVPKSTFKAEVKNASATAWPLGLARKTGKPRGFGEKGRAGGGCRARSLCIIPRRDAWRCLVARPSYITRPRRTFPTIVGCLVYRLCLARPALAALLSLGRWRTPRQRPHSSPRRPTPPALFRARVRRLWSRYLGHQGAA